MTRTETPAATLRRAADLIRKLSAEATPPPWEVAGIGDFGWSLHMGDFTSDDCTTIETEDSEQGKSNAAFIAAMHPGVSLALADWLDTEAVSSAGDENHAECGTSTCTVLAALAVARQLLGEAS